MENESMKTRGNYIRVMSYFNPPVTNKRPAREISLQMLHREITSSEALRHATERVRRQLDASNPNYYRAEKQQKLPYVTPAGVFRYCAAKDLVFLNGLQVFDIDHLSSLEEARDLRDRLFADEEMNAQLAFVSPSGRGVKLFVPYSLIPSLTVEANFKAALEVTWGYLDAKYDIEADASGCDIARACFLAFDPEAKLRE